MTDQHKVPIKNLSILSVETIFGYMTPGKVFEVAIQSESFYKLLETIKVPVDCIELVIRKSFGNVIECCWNNNHPGGTINEKMTGRINGKSIEWNKIISYSNYYQTESSSLVKMEDVTSHLLRILRPFRVSFNLDAYSAIPDCFVWKIVPTRIKCFDISFSCNSKSVITRENIKRVIENEEATDVTFRFESSSEVESEEDDGLDDDERKARDLEFHRQMRASLLDIPKKIKCETFKCDFEIISVDDLINSQCKRITLSNQVTQITNSDLNRLLKAWQKGEQLKNLERFEISDYVNESKLALEIMEGIELHHEDPTLPTSMKNYRRKIEFDYGRKEDGMIIKRKTDNALASIIIENHYIDVIVRKNIE